MVPVRSLLHCSRTCLQSHRDVYRLLERVSTGTASDSWNKSRPLAGSIQTSSTTLLLFHRSTLRRGFLSLLRLCIVLPAQTNTRRMHHVTRVTLSRLLAASTKQKTCWELSILLSARASILIAKNRRRLSLNSTRSILILLFRSILIAQKSSHDRPQRATVCSTRCDLSL